MDHIIPHILFGQCRSGEGRTNAGKVREVTEMTKMLGTRKEQHNDHVKMLAVTSVCNLRVAMVIEHGVCLWWASEKLLLLTCIHIYHLTNSEPSNLVGKSFARFTSILFSRI